MLDRLSSRIGLGLMCAVVCAATNARAQLSDAYLVTDTTAAYDAVTAGTELITDSDDAFVQVTLPFTFRFYDRDYTKAWVSVNGGIAFVAQDSVTGQVYPLPGANQRFPASTQPQAVLGAFWDDWVATPRAPEGGTSIRWSVVGNAPDREVVFDWQRVQVYGFTGPDQLAYSFQIRLKERSNEHEVRYGPRSGNAPNEAALSGSMGSENHLGTLGLPFAGCNPNCTADDLVSGTGKYVTPNKNPELSINVVAQPPQNDNPVVTLNVVNIGKVAADNVDYAVYLSQDGVLDATDLLVQQGTIPTIAAVTGVYTASITADVSALEPGALQWIAVVDPANVFYELNKRDNTFVLSPAFLVGPELSTTIRGQRTVVGGEDSPLALTVKNDGIATAAGIKLQVFFAGDRLGTQILPVFVTQPFDVPPLTTLALPLNLPVPSDLLPGTYRITVLADSDDVARESIETNNITVTPLEVDLRGPDLAVTGIKLGSDRAPQGGVVPVQVSLNNNGLAKAAHFYFTMYLSTNDVITLRDVPAFTSAEITLDGNQVRTINASATIPPDIKPGTYYVGVIADAEGFVPELDRNNNIGLAPTQLTITEPAGDPAVKTVYAQPRATAGEVSRVSVTFSNFGSQASTFSYGVYLSSNATVSENDLRVGEGQFTLPATSEGATALDARIPSELLAGSYTLGIVIDTASVPRDPTLANNVGVAASKLQIDAPLLAITTSALPTGAVGVPYAVQLAARGGNGTYAWELVSGSLPAGLTFDGQGRISGTPTGTALTACAIQLKSGDLKVVRAYTLSVDTAAANLSILDTVLPSARKNVPYRQTISALGGVPPYTFSLENTLPSGFTFAADGKLVGLPTEAGEFTIRVKATDSASHVAIGDIQLKVYAEGALTLADVGARVREAEAGRAFSTLLKIQGGLAPYTVRLLDGALPAGVTVTMDATGVAAALAGTPADAGIFTFSVQAKDARGETDVARLVLRVVPRSLSFITTNLPDAEVGKRYDAGIETNAKGTPTFALVSGSLPPGLVLSGSTITGTVAADAPARVYAFAVLVRDSSGGEALAPFAINIPVPAIRQVKNTGCSSSPDAGLLALVLGAAVFFLRRRRVTAAMVAAVVAVCTAGAAQAQQLVYKVNRSIVTYQALPKTGPTVLLDASATQTSASLTLPFTFSYWGTPNTVVGVSKHGLLVFSGTNDSSANAAMPAAAAPNLMLAPFWDLMKLSAITPDGPSMIRWQVDGTTPNRVVTVEWSNMQKDSTTESGANYAAFSFQVRLFEGSNDITVHYGGAAATLGAIPAMTATLGAEGPNGSQGIEFAPTKCSPSCLATDFPFNYLYSLHLASNLRINSLTAPGAGVAGDSATIRLNVGNNGGLDAKNVKVRFLLSDDALVDLNKDVVLGESAPVTILAGSSTDIANKVSIPSGVNGLKYILAVVDADDALAETNEDDNIATPALIALALPAPDFVPTRLLAPTSLDTGSSFDATRTIANQGTKEGAGTYRIYVSDNEFISSADTELATGSFSLAVDDAFDISSKVSLPGTLPPGRYWLGMILTPESGIVELNAMNNTAVFGPITLRGGALAVSTTSLPNVTAGVAFSLQLQASGGRGDYVWSMNAPSLPTTVKLSATGELSGRLDVAGEWPVQIIVQSSGLIATQNFTLRSIGRGTTLNILSTRLQAGVAGGPYEGFLYANGGTPPYTWTLDGTSALPEGLILGRDGTIEGSTMEESNSTIQVKVTDSMGETDTASVTLPISGPVLPVFATTHLPDAKIGEAYDLMLKAAGGSAPYRFEVVGSRRLPSHADEPSPNVDGKLPEGLTLSSDGHITGQPTIAGVFAVNLRVADAESRVDEASFILVVTSTSSLAIVTSTIPDAIIGEQYGVQFVATGGEGALTWELVFADGGALPTGLIFTSSGGIIGSAISEGIVSFIVKVTDTSGQTAVRAIGLRARTHPTVVVTEESSSGCSSVGGPSALLLLALLTAFRRRRLASGALVLAVVGLTLSTGCSSKQAATVSNCVASCEAPFVCDEADGLCKCGGAGGAICGNNEVCDVNSKTCTAATCSTSCPSPTTCGADGACHCGADDGPVCGAGTECSALGRCVSHDVCEGVVCTAGMTCDPSAQGACRCGPGGSACEANERCVDAQCVTDKCFGVYCAGGTSCDVADGLCKCGGVGGAVCRNGESCDATAGSCVRTNLCDDVTCTNGLTCDPTDGECKCGGLAGALCGADQSCNAVERRCVGGDLCQNVTCTGATSCDPEDGVCKCGGLGGATCGGADICVATAGQYACRTLCDPLSPTACAGGLACAWDTGATAAYCVTPGPAKRGDDCGEEACIAGLHCDYDNTNKAGICRAYCSADNQCDAGQLCAKFAAGEALGMCVAQ